MHPHAWFAALTLAGTPTMTESPHDVPDDLSWSGGGSFGGAPEYPRAVQFLPAHPSNQVAGGMQTPEYVIIHTQEGVYEGTISWFQYSGSNVSTHYVMRSVDGEITQMVRHADMAQHIGGYNPVSFGIEHEGYIYEQGWYTWETYVESARLTRWLCDRYGIPIDRQHIVGHVEVPGASHTDPGPYWEWDMYMALIDDVVPEGRVEGHLVDASEPCTLTATADTWITTTLEKLDMLDDEEVCFLPAGSELSYLHASQEMISQHRLTLTDEGPCGGLGTLANETFIFAPSFTALCPANELAAATDVTVSLDGRQTTVDANGYFAFEGVVPGAHTIEVESNGTWEPVSVPIEVEAHPGLHVVVALDPGAGGGESTGSAGDSGHEPETSTSSAGEGGDGSTTTGEALDDDTPDDDEATTSGSGGLELDPPRGEPQGCGCRTRPEPLPATAGLMALLLVAVRRRHERRA